MTSSSRIPRAVTLPPADAGAIPAAWTPDELPRGRASLPAAHRPGAASQEEARLSQAAEDGYARGYEQGFKAGEFAEGARLRSTLAALEEGLVSLERESARWVGNAEENICALAVAVARHLIGRELSTSPELVVEAVRLALAEFPVGEAVRVHLNPQDLQVVTAALADGEGRPAGRSAVRWSADARLAPGSCLLEGSDRLVDGRVDMGLERLYRRLSHAGG